MTDSPNARGWRHEFMFVDLEAVLVAERQDDGRTVLVMSGGGTRVGEVATTTVTLWLEDDVAKSLFDKLEIYRSGR